MPDIDSTTKLLQGFNCLTDSGALKNLDGEYPYLQNIRGWGKYGTKRKGIQTIRNFDSGIMGMFDLKIDGDSTLPDKVLIVTYDGSIWLFNSTEIVSSFDILFASGIKLFLESPNGEDWNITPAAATGIITPTSTAAIPLTNTTDYFISNSTTLGFATTSNIWRLYLDDDGTPITESYPLLGGASGITANMAFITTKGLVFESSTGVRRRLTINNSGALVTTEI